MHLAVLITIFFVSLAFFLRGGSLHNYLVCEAGKIFRNAGYETHQEHPEKLPDGGLDFIDLLARRGKFVICIEVELSARYILSNATKARKLKLPLVVLVPSRRVQIAVRNKLEKAGISLPKHRIYILLLSQLEQEVMNYFPLFFAVNKNRENK
jgi:hypothetical protein